MFDDVVFHVDRVLGDGLEKAVRAHHHRRLHRLGWGRALDPVQGIWAAGSPPPRSGNAIDVLIDGESAFPAVVDAISGATSHVHLAGWYMNPDFRLIRDGERSVVLRDLLEQVARRIPVRVLLWAGAPVPLRYQTSRPDVRDRAEELCRGSRVHLALDAYERPLHCHHEKIVVVDDEIAFVGGIEPTTAGGDRYDGQHHRSRGDRGWHDATTRLRGPIVADVAEHFLMRWREVAGEELASPRRQEPAGEVKAQIVRTVPEKVYKSLPHGDFSILESYTRALRSARRLIYFENQFLWSPHIVDLLADKLNDPPTDEFRVVLLLPSRPTTGMDDTLGQLGILLDADRAGRLLTCTLYAHSEGEVEQVYVHAKIGIVDDEWLTVGSANLNNHSLFNDTEMNVVTCDRDLARNTRLRLWSEHLERDLADVEADATRVVDEIWRPTAEEQLRRRERGQPPTHRLMQLPHASRRAKRLLGPVQGLMVDG